MIYYIGSVPFVSDCLQHDGILGMKWGLRRYRNKDGTLTQEGKERYYGAKKLKGLSDDELKQRTNRLNLENNYMSAKQKSKELQRKTIKTGFGISKKIFGGLGKATMAFVSSTFTAVGKAYLTDMVKEIEEQHNTESTPKKEHNNYMNDVILPSSYFDEE